ncbi:MAG: DUF5663 domain-containing protein [Patescibacteria group bacterium]
MQKQNMQSVRQNIIKLFDIDKLPEDKQEEMISEIGSLIFQSVLIRVLPLLEEKDLAEYEKLTDQKMDIEKLFDFFFEKIPNFLQIVTEESENFRKDATQVLENI